MPSVNRHQQAHEIAETLVLLAVKLPRVLRALDQHPTLTATEASALAVLMHAGSISMGTLAEYENVTPASISRTVRVLEERGLVTKSREEGNARVINVAMTPLGAETFETGHARKIAPLLQWVEGLQEQQRSELHSVVALLKAASELATPES